MPTITSTCQDCRIRPAEPRSTRCAGCQKANQQVNDRYRNRKAANAWENKSHWRNCSAMLKRQNPQCQRIWHGVRCLRPSEICHHLEDPISTPAKRLDPANLVCVCRSCHPTTTGDLGVGTYAPTIVHTVGITTTYTHGPADQQQHHAPGSIADALRWMAGR